MFGKPSERTRQEEVIFEYVPESSAASKGAVAASRPRGALAGASAGAGATAAALHPSIDEKPGPATMVAASVFQKREEAESAAEQAAAEQAAPAAAAAARRSSFQQLEEVASRVAFEPAEQKVAKLQAEVLELLALVEASGARDGNAAADLLGGRPAEVTGELRGLEKRLEALAKEGPAAWHKGDGKVGSAGHGPLAMPAPLVKQLEAFAAGAPQKQAAPPPSGADAEGRVTYELRYAPSAGAVAESMQVAQLEVAVREVEKHLGAPDPNAPFSDLHSAVADLQRRVSLLDPAKIDSIAHRVKTVMEDIDRVLAKTTELDGGGEGKQAEEDAKVHELYELCHQWNAAAGALPSVLSRLRSLQALHQQSASFAQRLQALEQQQDELQKLLETTNSAVRELGEGLTENTAIARDNMRALEEKVATVLAK